MMRLIGRMLSLCRVSRRAARTTNDQWLVSVDAVDDVDPAHDPP
jgi:hypothetical protein